MADISKELQAWKNARLGKDVRQAQIDLSTKINAEVEQNTDDVSHGIENINAAVTRAETAAGNADAKAAAANSAAAAANTAAARAEGYVLGDITDKTVTYTEPATAGDIAPASGAKISAVVGWVVKRVKELGESIAGVKNKANTKNITTQITWNSNLISDAPSGCQLFKTLELYNLKIFFKSATEMAKDGVYLLGTISKEDTPTIQTNVMCHTFAGISGYIVISKDGKINFTPQSNIGSGYWIFGDGIYCR